MKKELRRAWQDTVREPAKSAFLGLSGFSITFFVLWWQRGWSAAVDEFGIWLASIVGAVGAFFLLLTYNFFSAPYRIERDARCSLENKVAELEAALEVTRAAADRSAEPFRRLTNAQRLGIAGAITRSNTSKHATIFTSHSGDCIRFAQELADAIRMAGVDVEILEAPFERNYGDFGVDVYHYTDSASQDAKNISAAIRSFGIPSKLEVSNRPPQGKDSFALVIHSVEGPLD